MFAWMRPNDLVWNYVVNNYLLGNEPPAHDILFWNNDTTRLPAQLHADFLGLFESNPFRCPRQASRARPEDRPREDRNRYVCRRGPRRSHHLWQGVYRTAQMFGKARSTFVLSNGGHIQSLINPPGNKRSWFVAGAARAATPEAWLAEREKQEGSWWPHWREWIRARSGSLKVGACNARQQAASTSGRGARYLRARAVDNDMRSRSRSRRPDTHMRIDHAHIAGHRIRYGVRGGDTSRPPLLILNGLGANIELAEPFIDALPGPTVVDLRCSRRRRLADAVVSVSARGDRPPCSRAARPPRVCRGRRARRVVGRRDRAAVRVPAPITLPTAGARGDGARNPDGTRASVGAGQDGDAAAVHRQPTRSSHCRRCLRRRIPARSRARVAHASPRSFFRSRAAITCSLLPSSAGPACRGSSRCAS